MRLTLKRVHLFRFIDGKQAWGGFSRKAFVNWGPLLGFAASGVVMTCSEVYSFNPLTPSKSQNGSILHLSSEGFSIQPHLSLPFETVLYCYKISYALRI